MKNQRFLLICFWVLMVFFLVMAFAEIFVSRNMINGFIWLFLSVAMFIMTSFTSKRNRK